MKERLSDSGDQPRESGHGRRPLQGDKSPCLENFDVALLANQHVQALDVIVLAAAFTTSHR